MTYVPRKRNKVCGIGINDAQYNVREGGVTCPYYTCWSNMLTRCYDSKFHIKNPSYVGVQVCDSWLLFSNFKEWMRNQDWEGNVLDKDLLGRGSRIYSPSTCCFMPGWLNKSLKNSTPGEYPLGVTYKNKTPDMLNELRNPYQVRANERGARKHLGVFSCPKAAHKVWQLYKASTLEAYTREIVDGKIKEEVLKIVSKLRLDAELGLETVQLIGEEL